MPTFDDLLSNDKADADGDGKLSKAEAQKTMFKDFFDNNDPNKDGIITRKEWDAMLAFMAASKNSAFALKTGGTGDVTQSHMLWKQTKGLPYVPSAIVYRGQYVMVKDGGIVTAYDAADGRRDLSEAGRRVGQLLRFARRGERPHLLRLAGRRRDHGAQGRRARSRKSSPRIRRWANAWPRRRRSRTTRFTFARRDICTRLPTSRDRPPSRCSPIDSCRVLSARRGIDYI